MNSRHGYFIAFLIGHVLTHTSIDIMKNIPESSFPWVGMLRISHPRLREDRTIGIVLISRAVAVGNAYQLSKIGFMALRNKAKAEFLIMGNAFYYDVKDYVLHPEFYHQKVNTIAVVNMVDDERDALQWQPIKWPRENFSPKKIFYAVGYTDVPNHLEQEIHVMIPVTNQTCKDFYVHEQMDFESMWPAYTICLRETTEISPCLYDAGMALVSYSHGFWYLLGISVHGPGCSVPSRFIDLYPYTHWIEERIGRLDADDRPPTISDEEIPPEPHLDRDRVIINYGLPGTMELYFLRKGQRIFDEMIDMKEWQNGHFRYKCPFSVKDYTERGYIYSWPKTSAYALITISYFDIFVNNLKCMIINVRGKKRSPVSFNTTQGFVHEDLKLFQRLGPGRQSKIVSLDDTWNQQDFYKFLHIWLKVRVHWKAWYEIEFHTGFHSRHYMPSVELLTEEPEWEELTTLEPFHNIFRMSTTTEETRTNKYCKYQHRRCNSRQKNKAPSIAASVMGYCFLNTHFISALFISLINMT